MNQQRSSTSKALLFACLSLIGCDCGSDGHNQNVDSINTGDAEIRDAAPQDASTDARPSDATVDAAGDAETEQDAGPLPDAGGVRIGAAGGSFGNDALTVTIPAGALSAETTFGVTIAPNGAPDARGGTWDLGPNGTTFTTPATLTFYAGKIASGIELAELVIMTVGTNGWQVLDGITRDATAQTVSAPLMHFSPYALVYVSPKPVTCPADVCANGTCEPGTSDWTCRCNDTFAYDPSNKTCVAMKYCSAGACAHGQCTEGSGDFSCTCDPGYDGTGSKACTNHNDCVEGACAHGTCNDEVGSFSCTCEAGYDYDATTKACVNHNDCKPEYCAGGTCVDLVEDYVCMGCPEAGSGTKSCDGKDDCVGVTCANGHCVDGTNDYSCGCNSGFDQADSKTCTPHNDCPAGACANGSCVDLDQNYKCTCNPGYDGTDTKACTKHNYCAGNPCGMGGTCTDQGTSYTCACTAPYTAQNGTCVNLCANVACMGGTCSGGVCACPSDKKLENGVCVLKDPCAGVVCGLGGTCDATTGKCSCGPATYPDPYYGTLYSRNVVPSTDGKSCECARTADPNIAGSLRWWADCDGLPENGCEDARNSASACGMCSRCGAENPNWPLQLVPGSSPRPLTTFNGTRYAYQVQVPACPAPIKTGEVCGHYADDSQKYIVDWDFVQCVATATIAPHCVGKISQ